MVLGSPVKSSMRSSGRGSYWWIRGRLTRPLPIIDSIDRLGHPDSTSLAVTERWSIVVRSYRRDSGSVCRRGAFPVQREAGWHRATRIDDADAARGATIAGGARPNGAARSRTYSAESRGSRASAGKRKAHACTWVIATRSERVAGLAPTCGIANALTFGADLAFRTILIAAAATGDRFVDAPASPVAGVSRADVAVIAVARIADALASPVALVIHGAGIVVIARPSRDRREDAIAVRVAVVIGTRIVVIAHDRGVDALALDARVDGAQVVIVATDGTTAAVLGVVLEVRSDRYRHAPRGPERRSRRHSMIDKRILLRARAVADGDLVVPLFRRDALLLAPLLRRAPILPASLGFFAVSAARSPASPASMVRALRRVNPAANARTNVSNR